MKKKIQLLMSKYDTEVVRVVEDYSDETYWLDEGYIKLSEIIEVDFHEIEKEEIIKQQISVIDNQIKETMAKCEVAVNILKNRKQELLAIGCDK